MSVACVMIVAAEPSGDTLGAGLIRALRRRLAGGVRFVGVGGPQMAGEGVRSPFDITSLSVVGVLDAVAAYPTVLRRAAQTAEIARREHPDVAVLIDSWGFNLRVAHRLRRVDPALDLIKYVGPQVWATRPGRARTLARAVDILLSIHAFDAPWFEREGLRVRFVGNPALAREISGVDGAPLRAALDAGTHQPVLLVLPGSRPREVDRLLPPFEQAVRRLKSDRPGLKVVVAAADAVAPVVKARVAGWVHRVHVVEGDGPRRDAMAEATVALACSGTVTTELALCRTPMVVAYRLDALTYAVAKFLIRTPYITLFNVAAGDFVAPELIQNDCNGERIAREIGRLLDDPFLRQRQIEAQTAALEIMRGGIADPFAAAAQAVVERLDSKRARQQAI